MSTYGCPAENGAKLQDLSWIFHVLNDRHRQVTSCDDNGVIEVVFTIKMYPLVGGFNLPLWKMIKSVGMMTFPTEWKVIKWRFQTTNQISSGLTVCYGKAPVWSSVNQGPFFQRAMASIAILPGRYLGFMDLYPSKMLFVAIYRYWSVVLICWYPILASLIHMSVGKTIWFVGQSENMNLMLMFIKKLSFGCIPCRYHLIWWFWV